MRPCFCFLTLYHVEEDEANEQVFICDLCQYKAKNESAMKKHMTQKHKPKTVVKPQGGGEVVLDDDIEADMRKMAQWDKPADTETLTDAENNTEVVPEVAVINDATLEEGTIGQAVERFKALEEDLSVKEDVIKKLETELETAKDANSVATAEAASLEDEKSTLKTVNIGVPQGTILIFNLC